MELLANRRCEARSRRFLEHLLVSPLHGAVPLAQCDDISMRVCEKLHLDVARPLEVALAVERPVAEGARRLALGRGERVLELGGGANDAHPSTSASRRSLDEQRKSDLLGRSVGEHRDTCLAGDALRRELVAAEPKRFGRRADPCETGGVDLLGEARVLGEKAIARMHRVGARRVRRANVLLRIEIAGDSISCSAARVEERDRRALPRRPS